MFMNITPSTTEGKNNFILNFTSAFYKSGSSTDFILTSSPFKLAYSSTIEHYFGDIPLQGTINRQVIIYKIVEGQNITVINDAGLIDPDKGTVTLNNFTTGSTTPIRITTTPNSQVQLIIRHHRD